MEGRKITARKLIAQYRRGERMFRHVVLPDGSPLDGEVLDGAELWGAAMPHARLRGASLVRTRMQRADLRHADFRGADLEGANLWRVRLQRGLLVGARLDGTILEGADLQGARLNETRLYGTQLDGADLRGADLSDSVLRRVSMEDTRLEGVDLSHATLIDCVLPTSMSEVTDVQLATFDWRTVARSLHRPGMVELLERAGMPKLAATYLIDALHAIGTVNLTTMLHSVFLAHAPSRQPFADILQRALSDEGVKSWHVPRNDELSGFDRMILCCDHELLLRPGVLDQLEMLFTREEGRARMVFPILLDDVLDQAGAPPSGWPRAQVSVYRRLRKGVVADFREREEGSGPWWDEVQKLLESLRAAD